MGSLSGNYLCGSERILESFGVSLLAVCGSFSVLVESFLWGLGGAKGRFEFSAKGAAILWMLLQNAAEVLLCFGCAFS